MLRFVTIWFLVSQPALAAEPPHVAAFKKLQPLVQDIRKKLAEKKDTAPDKALTDLGNETMTIVAEAAAGLKGFLEELSRSFLGARTRAWEAFAEEPQPGELALISILLRADVIGGKLDRPQTLFDALGANVYLSSVWLMSAHAVATGSGKSRLPYGDYATIRVQKDRNVQLLHRFFPQGEPLRALFAVPPSTRPTAEVEKFLTGITGTVEGTKANFDGYRRSYPQKNHEAVLNQLSAELVDKPGALDCLNVARGLSDFDGVVCQPKEFARALDEYAAFFQKVGAGETLVLPTVEEFLLGLHEEKPGKVEKQDLENLASDLRKHVERSAFDARIKEKWPALEKRIFGNPAKLQSLLGKGLALHRFLKHALKSEGLVSLAGFDGDYFENGEAIKILQARFEKERLAAPEKLERVHVSDACTPYLEGKNSGTTVNTIVAASLSPRREESAAGFQRLVFANEVMVGDLKSIQNTGAVDRMVSGLGSYYALRLLVPNLVQLRLLLGKEVPASLEGLVAIKEKDMPGPLALVRTHYHFPEPTTFIDETKRAFQAMATAAWEELHEKTLEKPSDAVSWFIVKYRAELQRGAADLREVVAAKEKVKKEAALHANPAISEVLQIPVEFTGEFDRRFAAQVNDSLIKTFLPNMIGDYIRRKYPDAERDRQAYARHFKELQSSFSLDQFMDQLDWYWGMDLVRKAQEDITPAATSIKFSDVLAGKKRKDELPPRPLRRPDYIGVEELKLLWVYPEFAARLLNHTLESYQRKLDYLEYAEKRLQYRFPMLKWEDTYRSYDDSRYEAHLTAFLKHGEKQLVEVWAKREAERLLDYVMPNLPLLELVLRSHPDQKRGICEIQKTRGLWEKGTDIAMTSTAVVASTISLIPPLAPIGLAVDGVLLVVEGVRAYHRYQEFAVAESLWVTGSAQLESALYEEGGHLLREVEGRYTDGLVRVALQAAAMTPGVVMNFPLVARLPSTIGRTAATGYKGLRAAHAEWRAAIAVERAAAKAAFSAEGKSLWWANVSGRLANALSFTKAARDHLMFPFVHLGLAEKWAQRTLFQRLYPNLAWRRAHRLGWNGVGFVKDMVLHLPFSAAGYNWGRGVLARGVQVWGLYELTLWGVHSISNVREAATVLTLERIQQDPATYGDLIEAMHQGEITHAELLTIVQLDDDLAAKFRTSLHEWSKAFDAATTKEERAEVVVNLETLETTLRVELVKTESEPGFDPAKARMWRRVLRDSKRIRLGL